MCVALSAVSLASASAAETGNHTSAAQTMTKFSVIGIDSIPNNTAKLYTYGSNLMSDLGVIFTNKATPKETTPLFDEKNPVSVTLSSKSGYGFLVKTTTGFSGNNAEVLKFSNSGGTYQKIRLKLSDFSAYFNENGTRTHDIFDKAHNYNFTDEGNGYSSFLVFRSGAAVTATAPDKNGYVEFFVSTKLGEKTVFQTDFRVRIDTYISGGGGITGVLNGLTIGDVNKDGSVSLDDAILLQKKSMGLTSFDSLSTRNADTNCDGKVNLLDATEVQKYILGF